MFVEQNTEGGAGTLRVELIFFLSSALVYSFCASALNFFQLKELENFFYEELVLNHSFLLLGAALAALNLRAWSILFFLIGFQERVRARRALSLSFFIAIKLLFIVIILLFFVLKLKTQLLSLLIGFIGYLFSGALGTAIVFLGSRGKKFSANV